MDRKGEVKEFLKSKCRGDNYSKLMVLKNPNIFSFIAEYVQLCQPESIFVRTDSVADTDYIRRMAIVRKEELPLKMPGHKIGRASCRERV